MILNSFVMEMYSLWLVIVIAVVNLSLFVL